MGVIKKAEANNIHVPSPTDPPAVWRKKISTTLPITFINMTASGDNNLRVNAHNNQVMTGTSTVASSQQRKQYPNSGTAITPQFVAQDPAGSVEESKYWGGIRLNVFPDILGGDEWHGIHKNDANQVETGSVLNTDRALRWPAGVAQLTAIYTRYRVMGVKATWRIINHSSTGGEIAESAFGVNTISPAWDVAADADGEHGVDSYGGTVITSTATKTQWQGYPPIWAYNNDNLLHDTTGQVSIPMPFTRQDLWTSSPAQSNHCVGGGWLTHGNFKEHLESWTTHWDRFGWFFNNKRFPEDIQHLLYSHKTMFGNLPGHLEGAEEGDQEDHNNTLYKLLELEEPTILWEPYAINLAAGAASCEDLVIQCHVEYDIEFSEPIQAPEHFEGYNVETMPVLKVLQDTYFGGAAVKRIRGHTGQEPMQELNESHDAEMEQAVQSGHDVHHQADGSGPATHVINNVAGTAVLTPTHTAATDS